MITATAAPVSSRKRSRRRAADASGSSGSKTTVSASGAFEASTPAGPSAVLLVDVQDHGGHRLERPRVCERAGVDRTAGDELGGELERRLLRARVVAGDQRVLIRQLIRGELDRGNGL